MKLSDRKENILALCLIVFFLLPWVSILIVSFNAFEIPGLLRGGGSLGKNIKVTGGNEGTVFYALYLVPVLCALQIFFAVKKNRFLRALPVAAGLLVLAAFAFALIRIGSGIFDVLGIGAWLSLPTALALVVLPFLPIKAKPAA